MNCLTSRLFCNKPFLYGLIILWFAQVAQAAFDDIARIYRTQPNSAYFEVCQGGGCAKISKTKLSEQDWDSIKTIFADAAVDAAHERQQIATAIGRIETIIGRKIGTHSDRAGTFGNAAYTGQQDCNDEAINTTTYMRLLKQHGYIRFHRIEDLKTRNFFFTGWPHTTAVIRQIDNDARYAVDSWFYDNGYPATIVPFALWKDNYQPGDSPIGKDRD